MTKILMTVSNVTIEVFIFCYLFELVNDNVRLSKMTLRPVMIRYNSKGFAVCVCVSCLQKEAVNFGLYSSTWTAMDIKVQKLLLMSMKMNDANRLRLKATPSIAVDRPFFANVRILTTSRATTLVRLH